MDDKVKRTELVMLSSFRFRPVDVEWVEFDVERPFSKTRQTKIQLRSGKLFICASDEKDYRSDVDIISFVTDPDNWIRHEQNQAAEEEV